MTRLAGQRLADTLDAMVHYLVDTPGGAVGILDGWERDEDGRPTTLLVAQGWFGRRRVEIPVERLLTVDHDRRRLVLARGSERLEPKGPLQRLMELGRPAEDGVPTSPGSADHSGPVLCGVADDRHAATVVSVAARLARQLVAPLVLTHVTSADVPPGVSAAPNGPARLRDEEVRDANRLIDMLVSQAVWGTHVSRIIMPGAPAQTLEQLAAQEGAQLLVVGSGGKGAFAALLKGSVSHHVAGHAHCPVVVVPPDVSPTPRDANDTSSDAAVSLAG